MSENKIIKETKIFKHEIESPKIYSQDIILGGIHISKTIFDGQIMPRKLYSLDQIENTLTVTGKQSEQVVGFDFPVTESLRKNIIRSITLKRKDNDGDAIGLKQKVYMFIDSYDENNQLLQTVFSIEPVQQVVSDDLATKWQFNEYLVKNKCSRLKVGFSTTLGERQTDCKVRSIACKNGNDKIYVNGWNTYYPPSGSKQEYTTQFIIDYDYVVSGIQSHIDDDSVHLSPDEHQAIEALTVFSDHLKNTDVHLSSEEKTILQNFDNSVESVIESSELCQEFNTHKTTNDLHWSDDDRTFKTNTENHIKNGSLHLTTAQKNQIIQDLESMQIHINNSKIHITQEEKDKISSLIDAISVETIQHNIDTRQLLSDYTDLGNESIVGFTMTVDQSYKGIVVDELDLRRNDNTNLNGNNLYIYAQCFNSNDEQINVFYSTNTDTQISSDDKIMTWTFDDFVIPNECSSIKFHYTTVKGQKQTNVKVRTAKLLLNGTALYKDGWKTIWENETYKTFTTDFAIRGHKTKIDEIIELETLLDNHKGDDTHLTADQKNFIQTISSSFIETEQFTSKQDGMTITEKASCKYFDISKKHFISGVSNKIKLLKKIEIPYLSSGTVYNDVYLCIQFYKNSNEQKTLDDCIFSTNPQNQTNSNGLLSFEFTDVEIPEDYLFMRVYLCSDTTSIPDGTKLLRITPLKTNSLTFDDDECRVIGSDGNEYNWIVYLNAQTEEKFGYQNYKMLLQKVFDLSELVKSLQEELEELKGNLSN